MLDRVKGILQADTAAVLLLDFAAQQLIATAAAGLEDEVRQGVRIPVGQGFAGRIAAGQKPVILDLVDHTTVLNPILWEKGIRSMMGVPLVTGRRVMMIAAIRGPQQADASTPSDARPLVRTASYSANGGHFSQVHI